MPLVMEVDLNPGHIVLDGDDALPMERDTAALKYRFIDAGRVCL